MGSGRERGTCSLRAETLEEGQIGHKARWNRREESHGGLLREEQKGGNLVIRWIVSVWHAISQDIGRKNGIPTQGDTSPGEARRTCFQDILFLCSVRKRGAPGITQGESRHDGEKRFCYYRGLKGGLHVRKRNREQAERGTVNCNKDEEQILAKGSAPGGIIRGHTEPK